MFPPNKDLKVLAESLQWLLGPACFQANQMHCVIRRRRVFDAALLAQTLVLGFWRHPDASNTQLAQTACELGCHVSAQAVDKRCTEKASKFLETLLLLAVTRRVQSAGNTSWLKRFSAVELLDSTTLTLPAPLRDLWPGCSSTAGPTAALKVQTRVDFLHGDLRLELQPGVENDQCSRLKTQDLKANSLHLRDLGYFDLDTLQTIAAHQAFFVSRLQDATVLYSEAGERLNLRQELRRCKRGIFEMSILVGKTQRLPMRLVALRVPRDVAKKRRAKLRAKGRKKGYRPKAETLELRGWSIYVTNVSASELSAAQVQALLRLRWQIELLFKLWKSHSGLEQTRTSKPWRVLCETYAKLLAAVAQHWVMVTASWNRLNRSWFKAAQVIRDWLTTLGMTLRRLPQLLATLQRLCEIITHVAHTNTRRRQPAAHQVIADPEGNGYKRVLT